jgi:hypothetical protein
MVARARSASSLSTLISGFLLENLAAPNAAYPARPPIKAIRATPTIPFVIRLFNALSFDMYPPENMCHYELFKKMAA